MGCDYVTAEPPKFRRFKRPEGKRTYIFPDGHQLTINNMSAIAISERGTHRLETLDGEKIIVRCGWLGIVIEADDWEF